MSDLTETELQEKKKRLHQHCLALLQQKVDLLVKERTVP